MKLSEVQAADPYGTRREAWVTWRPEFRCGRTCFCSGNWWEHDKAVQRRERKNAARNWQRDY